MVGKNAQCKADEQFHFTNKNWVRNNNKNEKQEKTKKEKERNKQTTIKNTKIRTVARKQSKQNSGKNKTMLGR